MAKWLFLHMFKSRLVLMNSLLFVMGMMLSDISMSNAVRVPDQLKAAYLYNIAKLVDWPDKVLPEKDSHLIFCTSASETFTRELKTMSERPLAGRRVQVVALGSRSDADFCHLVFVDEHHTESWFKYHNEGRVGQLLIGENPLVIPQGGVINFFVEGEKLRFEISIQNAKDIDIKISSRLLKLARIVGGSDDD